MKKITSIKEWLNEQNQQPEYGCVMMDAKIPRWKEDHIDGIDPDDIYIKPYDNTYGLEDTPHITIIYGIHEDEIDPEIIMDTIKENMEPVTVTITNISIFKKDEYDVVKYDIPETKQLKKYRELFVKNFSNTQSFPEFHPHMTLAYVKPEEGKKYVKELEEPFEVTFDKGIYSFHKDGETIRKEHIFPNEDDLEVDLTVNEWYIPDLSPYNYNYEEIGKKINKKELAVGWLDDPNFPKGEVPENFLKKLKNAKTIHNYKGSHNCPFCTNITGGSSSETRGSRDEAIEYKGITYVFPELLKHYVKRHHYLPPEEFIEAVMNSKEPEDPDQWRKKLFPLPHRYQSNQPNRLNHIRQLRKK